MTIPGEVSRYEWSNPHVYIYVTYTADDGASEEWQFEADPTPLMSRNGWRPDTLVPGDTVIVRAYPDINPARNRALLISLTTPDGTVLTPRASRTVSSASATDFSGLWDGLRGFTIRHLDPIVPTDKGNAARSSYDEKQNPVSNCRAYVTPSLIRLPYLVEIEIQDDRILMRSEFYKVERTIFMDGREHPADAERTNQGHSIGRWEGDILVVDTTLFTNNPGGNRPEIPSGVDKRVVERFVLSDDRTRMLIDFTVEDPEYLAVPMTGTMEWDYAPDAEFLPFDCDPQNARQFAIE